MEWLTYLAKEWGVIGQAPFTFLIAAVLTLVMGYGLARWAFMVRLDTASDRLKLKDEQIADRDRKLGELRQVAESPPPVIEAHGDGTDDYSAVIRGLVQIYVLAEGNVSPGILAGTELPPKEWMNERLFHMRHKWRITNVRGPIAEIVAA